MPRKKILIELPIPFEQKEKVIYPLPETVNKVHDLLIEMFKGQNEEITRGILSIANLEHNLFETKRKYEDIGDHFDRITHKAAYLMHRMLTSHVYADGNKRTGLLIWTLFLVTNGYYPVIQDESKVYRKHIDFFKEIASKRPNNLKNVERILDWSKKYNKIEKISDLQAP